MSITSVPAVSNAKCMVIAYCAAVVMVLVVGALSIDGLGPIDNHHFISKTFQGIPFGSYVMPELGRFVPLTAQEYEFAARLFTPSAKLFYLINAAKIAVCGMLLLGLLLSIGAGPAAIAILWSVTMLSVGFGNAAYRLHVGEFNLFALTLVLIWCAIRIDRGPRMSVTRRRVVEVLAILAAGVGMFYKETAFVLVFAFGLAELLRYRRQGVKDASVIALGLLSVSLIYVVGYVSWRAVVVTGTYTVFHSMEPGKAIALFLRSDPFLMVGVLPLAGYRFWTILRDPRRHTIYDSCLVASFALLLGYVTLGMHATYYLLPAYGFAACGVAGFLVGCQKAAARAVLILGAACAAYSAPIAIADLQAERAIANNHLPFVRSLAEWLWNHPPQGGGRRTIVLAGVSAGSGVEVIYSLGAFLAGMGADLSAVDIVPSELTDSAAISDYYRMRSEGRSRIELGDVIVLNPYQQAPRQPVSRPSQEEIFRSTAEWALPRWSGWGWMRNCLSNVAECGLRARTESRYVGYLATHVKRLPAPVSLAPVKSPAYRIGPLQFPGRLRRGSARELKVLVQNVGTEAWPATGSFSAATHQVNMSYLWLGDDGKIALEGSRALFPESVEPGDVALLTIDLKAPSSPGRYRLVLSPVQEAVRWFSLGTGPPVEGALRSVEVY